MLNDRNTSQSDMIDILAKGVRRAMCRQDGCVSNAREWRAGDGSSAQTHRAAACPTPVLHHVGRRQGFGKTWLSNHHTWFVSQVSYVGQINLLSLFKEMLGCPHQGSGSLALLRVSLPQQGQCSRPSLPFPVPVQ